MVDVSIIMPGIRNERWEKVYDSLICATVRSFELIICGPQYPSEYLQKKADIIFIKDYGSPVRASMKAASVAQGKYITWTADDALFVGDALDKSLDILDETPDNDNKVVVSKYLEGVNGSQKPIQDDIYFKLNGSDWTRSPLFSDDWWLFNVGLMHRTHFERLGGWDVSFEGTFYSHSDLAARAQAGGSEVFMSGHVLLDCDHMPGKSGDHGPIDEAQVFHDRPLFHQRYVVSNGIQPIITRRWETAPEVWSRRFKNG